MIFTRNDQPCPDAEGKEYPALDKRISRIIVIDLFIVDLGFILLLHLIEVIDTLIAVVELDVGDK